MSRRSAFEAARDTWELFARLDLLPEQRYGEPKAPPTPEAIRLARAALIGSGAPSAQQSDQAPPVTAEQAVELTITLRYIEPPIWRRLLVPASLTLAELQPVIQIAMGWDNYHLHMFEVAGVRYGDAGDPESEAEDEGGITVGQLAAQVSAFDYEYDFGDGWDHEIRFGQELSAVGPVTPRLLAGERACPPEDCGGPGGYEHLLEALSDPTDEEHEQLSEWAGDYDPEAFDLERLNGLLDLHDRQVRRRRTRRR